MPRLPMLPIPTPELGESSAAVPSALSEPYPSGDPASYLWALPRVFPPPIFLSSSTDLSVICAIRQPHVVLGYVCIGRSSRLVADDSSGASPITIGRKVEGSR